MKNDKLTATERMRRFSSGMSIDRVPVITNGASFAAARANMSMFELCNNGVKSYNVQKELYELLQSDDLPGFSYPDIVTENCGGKLLVDREKLVFPKVIKYPISSLDEVEQYEFPDIKKSMAFKKQLEFIEIRKNNGNHGIGIWGGSPFSDLLNVVEPIKLFKWIRREPSLVHNLLDKMVSYLEHNADMLINFYGVDVCSVHSCYPGESNDLISPNIFKEFSLPYMIDIHKRLRDKGIKQFQIHLCGKHNDNLSFFRELGLNERDSISVDHKTDIKQTVKVLGKDKTYIGNVPTDYFIVGNEKMIYDYVGKLLEDMKFNEGGFILAPSCDLPSNAKMENVKAMVDAARVFGSYDFM